VYDTVWLIAIVVGVVYGCGISLVFSVFDLIWFFGFVEELTIFVCSALVFLLEKGKDQVSSFLLPF
jgi:hypothetical protein